MAHAGAVSRLVWAGMRHAHQLGLTFDFDGVTSQSRYQFMVGFGGQPATRFIVSKGLFLYDMQAGARKLADQSDGRGGSFFGKCASQGACPNPTAPRSTSSMPRSHRAAAATRRTPTAPAARRRGAGHRQKARRGDHRDQSSNRERRSRAPRRRERRPALPPAGAVGRGRRGARRRSGACWRRRSGTSGHRRKSRAQTRREARHGLRPQQCLARILRGEMPCRKIYEDEYVLAFHDINPLAPVHTLVIPKGEYALRRFRRHGGRGAEIAGFFRAVSTRRRNCWASRETATGIFANHGAQRPSRRCRISTFIFSAANPWGRCCPRSGPDRATWTGWTQKLPTFVWLTKFKP